MAGPFIKIAYSAHTWKSWKKNTTKQNHWMSSSYCVACKSTEKEINAPVFQLMVHIQATINTNILSIPSQFVTKYIYPLESMKMGWKLLAINLWLLILWNKMTWNAFLSQQTVPNWMSLIESRSRGLVHNFSKHFRNETNLDIGEYRLLQIKINRRKKS